jgi:hypothetical protein
MALNLTLRKSYLYLFATVGLVLVIFGGVSLIDLGLKTYVFKKADNYCYRAVPMMLAPDKNGKGVEPTQAELDAQKKQCEEQQAASREGQASHAVATLIVGLPLYVYHWMRIRKENQV